MRDWTETSFIDIAVRDGVREAMLEGKAVLVADRDTGDVRFANGTGAALFDLDVVGIQPEPEGPAPVAIRQLRGVLVSLGAEPRNALVRISDGLASRLVQADVAPLDLPFLAGRHALVTLALAAEGPLSSMLDGLEEEATGAAILDAAGRVLASGPQFAGMDIPDHLRQALAAETRNEDDRLVKRIVTAPSGPVAAGVGRLSDLPERYLLLVVALAEGAAGERDDSGDHAAGTAMRHSDTLVPGSADEAPNGTAGIDSPLTDDRGLTGESTGLADEPDAADDTEELIEAGVVEPEVPFAGADLSSGPIRFVWKTDSDGMFVDVSPEFARAVGPNAADIIGRTFDDVARVFDMDGDGEISAALRRRDTWSGKSVLWPVQGTDLRVPVDLAALPYYNRERAFEGYRGFGIARMADAVVDPAETGLILAGPGPSARTSPALSDMPEDDTETHGMTVEPDVADMPDEPEAQTGPAPLADEPPVFASARITPLRRESDRVVPFGRRTTGVPPLSESEADAFRRIGSALGAEPDGTDDADAGLPETGEDVPATWTEAGDGPEEDFTGHHSGQGHAEDDDAVQGLHEDLSDPGDPSGDDLADLAALDGAGPPDEAARDDIFGIERDVEPRDLIEVATRDDDGATPALRHALAPAALDSLPLPILIVRGEQPVYANAAFHAMSGDSDLEALADRGLDALFDGPALEASGAADTAEASLVTLTDAFGEPITARVHLQRVPFEDGNALMFAFEPRAAELPGVPVAPAAGVVEAEATTTGVPDADARVAELAAILDSATDGVVVLSEDGTIRSLNGSASALFGYASEEIVGKSFSYLFAHESQRAAMDYLHGLSNNGVASVLNEGREVLGRERRGGFLPLFMTLGRLPASKGFCAVMRDITAWKQTEQALMDARRQAESASNTKSEFLAKISHEIRTPLNAIIGFSELMTDERFGPVGNQRYREYLTDINKSGRLVLELVNDLLDISKIEAGKQELEFESVPLNDTIAETIAMVQPQANRNQLIVRSNLETNVPPVVADLRSIKQIVLNLLSNAIRFTHPGGQVIVSTSYMANGSVVLRVRDTGIGMNDKELQSAMQPFQQVSPAVSRRNDGTGLGLPLTKALVEANRAEFSIQSEPGQGTRVDIVFPPARVLAS